MGTLGRYLHEARVARGIDLRDAAHQTRISVQYLRALEEENFKKLPGDVFVRGFLKSYARFLRLDEAEVMKQYIETVQKPSPAGAANQAKGPAAPETSRRASKIPIEPFVWGAGILVILILFLLTALPSRRHKASDHAQETPVAGQSGITSAGTPTTPEKLYLEVLALDNTWLLVRTDSSPQKKAILKKGESLIWSADQRFLLSYGSAGAVKLLLNGQELTVDEPAKAVIRDLMVTAAGIVSRKTPTEQRQSFAGHKPPAVRTQPTPSAVTRQTPHTPAPEQEQAVQTSQPPQSNQSLPPAPGKMPKMPAQ